MKSRYNTKDLGIMALFVSIGIILQYVENLILISPVPGGKLGLSNIVSIINIFMFGGGNAMVISLIRAFLGTVISGGISALPYSMTGAFFSTLFMCILKKYGFPKISMIGISVVSACMHNFAQICVAAVIMSSHFIFSYIPVLLIVGVISGTVTGYAAQIFGNRVLRLGD